MTAPLEWHEANRRALAAALEEVLHALDPSKPAGAGDAPIPPTTHPPALDSLTALFGLTRFERSILVLCAGLEIEPAFASVCPAATLGLALNALPEPHWSALSPSAALRRWKLIEVSAGDALTSSPLRIDERILHFLLGVECAEPRLCGAVEPVPIPHDLSPAQQEVAGRIAALWAQAGAAWTCPPVEIGGIDPAVRQAVAAAACAALGIELWLLDARDIPASLAERENLALFWKRESILRTAALVIETEEIDVADLPRALAFAERLHGVVIVSSREALRATRRPRERFELPLPSEPLPMRYRPHLEGLAQRIEPAAGWGDLVLPEVQLQSLRSIAAQMRQRGRVYEQWGFARKSGRGLGLAALFSGASGTGKTMAAEVLAVELKLDLYRIDLSAIVSKYIGETEKNLRRVFDAAEQSGAILLFDEADALFGKRSEVQDSHDRYANIEVSYLLQRIEAYRGLAILTTNLKGSIDPAFLRRFRFVIHFPFPDTAQRAEIWRRTFPAEMPAEGLDFSQLAKLDLAGGNIRNLAVNAAFLAADRDEPVRMSHLLTAARGEYAKLEKPLNGLDLVSAGGLG